MSRAWLEPAGRAAVLVASSCVVGACGSNATASSRQTASTGRSTATEWTGGRVEKSAPAPSADDPGGQVPSTESPQTEWVLHIGDSFTHAFFEQNLLPRFRAAGVKYIVDATTSTHTTSWAHSVDLERWLARRPALVLITLGANEFDIPFPSVRGRAVATIAHEIAAAGASCVWITPPMWRPDTGILQVIYEHRSPCAYFDSDAVLGGLGSNERQPDRIHPNKRGGARWAEAFWAWLMDHKDPNPSSWTIVPFEQRASW